MAKETKRTTVILTSPKKEKKSFSARLLLLVGGGRGAPGRTDFRKRSLFPEGGLPSNHKREKGGGRVYDYSRLLVTRYDIERKRRKDATRGVDKRVKKNYHQEEDRLCRQGPEKKGKGGAQGLGTRDGRAPRQRKRLRVFSLGEKERKGTDNVTISLLGMGGRGSHSELTV